MPFYLKMAQDINSTTSHIFMVFITKGFLEVAIES